MNEAKRNRRLAEARDRMSKEANGLQAVHGIDTALAVFTGATTVLAKISCGGPAGAAGYFRALADSIEGGDPDPGESETIEAA